MLDDKEIGIAISNGDTNTFEQVFHSLYEKLCKYAYGFIPDSSECEDMVQQCFVRLWDRRESAHEIQSLKSYLYRAVYNACMNKLQHERVVQNYETTTANELEEIYYSEFENTLPDEKIYKVYEALNVLPTKNKEVFTMRFIEGLSTKAVSEKLNVTIRTVETHVSKSLKLLRKALEVTTLLVISFLTENSFFDTWF